LNPLSCPSLRVDIPTLLGRGALVSWDDVPGCDECYNGLDDDGDGLIDYPDDPECSGPEDYSEEPDCEDGLDNDADGLTDFPDDPGCYGASAPSEKTACDDGLDNDGDTYTDFPDDAGCFNAAAPSETTACDDGLDNDGDGFCDMPTSICTEPGVTPGDLDCNVPWDNSEAPWPGCGLGFELASPPPPAADVAARATGKRAGVAASRR
jgi:hypothetical protein